MVEIWVRKFTDKLRTTESQKGFVVMPGPVVAELTPSQLLLRQLTTSREGWLRDDQNIGGNRDVKRVVIIGCLQRGIHSQRYLRGLAGG